jgi:hypothetical protein
MKVSDGLPRQMIDCRIRTKTRGPAWERPSTALQLLAKPGADGAHGRVARQGDGPGAQKRLRQHATLPLSNLLVLLLSQARGIASSRIGPGVASRSFQFLQVAGRRRRRSTSASAFLEALIAALPIRSRRFSPPRGIQFTFPPCYAEGPTTARYMTHVFNMHCRQNGIEHRLIKIKHHWTNGQVECINPTIRKRRPTLSL